MTVINNVVSLKNNNNNNNYLIGTGIADVTGPLAEYNMMGYADLKQTSHGLHMRLNARTFIFVDPSSEKRVAFVNVEIQACMRSIKQTVISRLKEIYEGLYDDRNVLISATHTHSGPGAYSWDVFYYVTALGYYEHSLNVIVEGIVSSFEKAHNNLKPSRMFINNSHLRNASINRSLWTYQLNPEHERKQYEDNVDTTFTTLRIDDVENDQEPSAMINFFAVHPTSMNKSNELVSSDNKGYAAYLFEKYMNSRLENNNNNSKKKNNSNNNNNNNNNNRRRPGSGPFIAAFANSNCGDISPNTAGTRCTRDGSECDFKTSTCSGLDNLCIGSGPGSDMFESTKIIGEKQYEKAREQFESDDLQEISGPIDYVHTYIDLGHFMVDKKYTGLNESVSTCRPAAGDSFAAGTTDGVGFPLFKQAETPPSNILINEVMKTIFEYGDDMKQCHHPKNVFLNLDAEVHGAKFVTSIQPMQIIRIGSLFLVAVPGEITSMAGRRLRETVQQELKRQGVPDPHVIISAYANSYTLYTSTFEEYAGQRYEGGATLFGPHQLHAYQQVFSDLAYGLVNHLEVPSLDAPPQPPLISLHPPNVLDVHPLGKSFGTVTRPPHRDSYSSGDRVVAEFVASDLNTCFKKSYTACQKIITVERRIDDGDGWEVYAYDGEWDIRFHWRRYNMVGSRVTAEWRIPSDTPSGIYRLVIDAYAKVSLFHSSAQHYTGATDSFQVLGSEDSAFVHVHGENHLNE